MNKVLIVLMFILLGTSLIVVSNMGKEVQNSFVLEYHNNKNISYPDLSTAVDLGGGNYRLYNGDGIIINYNLNMGHIYINGTVINGFNYNFTNLFDELNSPNILSYYYGYGSITGNLSIFTSPYNANNVMIISSSNYMNNNIKVLPSNLNLLRFQFETGQNFNQFQFMLQLEKGTIPTRYLVPKLIPVYKDNLTQEEKQEIGFGAFGGLSQIIRSVDSVIKPIGNFINGVLNLFK